MFYPFILTKNRVTFCECFWLLGKVCVCSSHKTPKVVMVI